MEVFQIPVDRVVVPSGRFREDLGDASGEMERLMVSINTWGQLVPIILDDNDNLVDGERRLVAHQRMAMETVFAVRNSTLTDADKARFAEFETTDCRKQFTGSELVKAKRFLEALRGPKEAPAQAPAKFGTAAEEAPLPAPQRPLSQRQIAKKLGVSHETLRQASVVVAAAEKDPEKFEPVRQKMDETNNIYGAFKEVVSQTAPTTFDMGESLRSDLLRRLSCEAEIVQFCKTPVGSKVDQAKILEHLSKAIAALQGKRRIASQPILDADHYALELWDIYPRKEGKAAALKAIAKARETTSVFELKEAVTAYAEAKRGEDPKFIPHPATWFNQRRWEDDRSTWAIRGGDRGRLDAIDSWQPESDDDGQDVIDAEFRREE